MPDPTASAVSLEHDSVVISHGANQVNACRDATRHAELVALDRLLTGSVSTDQLRLPESYLQTKKKNKKKRERAADPPNQQRRRRHGYEGGCIHPPNQKKQPRNGRTTGSMCRTIRRTGRMATAGGARQLPATAIAGTAAAGAVRPLRHVRAVHHVRRGARPDGRLAEGGLWLSQRQVWRVRVDPVVASKGTDNNSNRIQLAARRKMTNNNHSSNSSQYYHYPITSGVLEQEAIDLLRSFYNRENFHAPDDKRRRKDG